MNEPSNDIRGALDAAYEKVSGEPESPAEPVSGSGPADNVEIASPAEPANDGGEASGTGAESASTSTRARAPDGKFTKAEAKAVATPAPKPEKQAATVPPKEGSSVQTQPPVPGEQTATPPPAAKAPQSWKPTEREHWGKLPSEVQAAVSRREAEIAQTLQGVAPLKRFEQEFSQTVSPFLGMIQAEGSTPMKAVGNLLQTAAALRTAPPAHKAQLVAGLVQQFGIPLEMLAAAIDGKAPPQGQARGVDPRQLEQQIEERILGRFQQQRQQTTVQQAQQELEKFAGGAEFLEDVRAETAAIMEAAAHRGQQLSLQEAYDRACYASPEVRAILQQRERAKAATAAQGSAQRAAVASVSVKSQPTGPTAPGPQSIRGALDAAFAKAQSGRK